MRNRSKRPVQPNRFVVQGVLGCAVAVGGLLVTGCGSQRGSMSAADRESMHTSALASTASPYAALPSAWGLSDPQPLASVEAIVTPPTGWKPDPLKITGRHAHQVWISPSGNTAYGVIRFKMPLPVGADLALDHGFLPNMRKTEGEATLLSREKDSRLPGIRFVVEGGLYKLRTNMITRGWKGWAIYAGTLRKEEVVPEELETAERAREQTRVGLPRNFKPPINAPEDPPPRGLGRGLSRPGLDEPRFSANH